MLMKVFKSKTNEEWIARIDDIKWKADHEIRKLNSENKNLNITIGQLRGDIRGLKDDHRRELRNAEPFLATKLEQLAYEHQDLQARMERLRESKEILETEKAGLMQHVSQTQGELEQCRKLYSETKENLRSMGVQKSKTEYDNRILTERNGDLVQQVRNLEEKKSENEQRIDECERDIELKNEKIDALRADNEQMRSHIYRNDRAVGPIRGEEYYHQSFKDLSGEFENWAVKNSRLETPPLSKSNEASLLSIIRELPMDGKATAELLGSNQVLREWHAEVRSRMVLVRHIVSLFMFNNIFEPLVFALPPDALATFQGMEKNIWSKGISSGAALI
jgi:DNA repair exonuclease SbcCD ATPase subunit